MNTRTMIASQVRAEEMPSLNHLSGEQIDDHLIGDLDDVAAAHLAECDECVARVAEATEPMTAFRDVTIAWSERRSATMPIPVVQADALVWQRRTGWAMAACALVVGISLTSNSRDAAMLRSAEQSAPSVTASTTTARAVRMPVAVNATAGNQGNTAQYEGDNQMLKAIDSELDASNETPAALGLDTVSDQPREQSVQSSVAD